MPVLMNFRLEEDLRQQFHIWCIQNKTTIAERLRSHIESDLDEQRVSAREVVRKKLANREVHDWRDEMIGRDWESTY